MAIHAVWHVGFSVRDIEASIDFYTNGLGLELTHRQSQSNPYTHALVGYPDASLKIAQFVIPGVPPPPSGHVLELIEYVVPRGARLPMEHNRIAAGHLAFEVDDIIERAHRLRALGAELVSEPVEITAGINKGGRAVYLHDPDGITLELLQPRRRMSDDKVREG
jgi:lactoylglutathione lyase